ncbi:kinase domain protein [Ceratobasidium sp. AG-Ba]|nr:kinase domain protein [Ceratobasidium sp. AG-Ba]
MSWIRRLLPLARGAVLPTVPLKPPTLLPLDILVEEETTPNYDPHYYYPARLLEVLNDRYQITNKIGYGRSSTLWLARDICRWKWQEDRFVTIKIFSSHPEYEEMGKHEAEISKHIMSTKPDHPGLFTIRKVFESFSIASSKGSHICLICEPMRETLDLYQTRFPNGTIDPTLLKPMIRLFLSSLDYIHSECKVIHTDIKTWNILMSIEDLSLFKKVAEAEEREPGPRKVLEDRTIYRSLITLKKSGSGLSIPKLTDFGNAVRGDSGSPLKHPIQPNEYRSPEVCLRAEWSYPTDVWNLGVMIWDLLEGRPLCDGLDSGCNEYTVRAQIAQLIALLGPPPPEFLAQMDRAPIHFFPDGRFKSPELIPEGYTLESSVTQLKGEDKRLFLEFARRMLCWLPEDRATCKELLSDPWLHFEQ